MLYLVLVYNVAVVLVVPARMQLVLFHPLANVYVGKANCFSDLLTSGSLPCSWGPSHQNIRLLPAHKVVTNTA